MNYFWLIFGFGFVVFFHELGHFMAAKWVGIRCEQFAVGFGQALLAYRKKIGWRIGSTNKEVRKICTDHLASKGIAREGPSDNKESEPEYSDTQIQKTMDELGYGETEYRLNWIPLGGYVKMLGQDDTNASATSSHPNAFTSKSIPARMLVVSAGVIMNIILAAIGFMWIFYNGHQVPAPVVGTVFTNSPAQKAGVQVGDRIVRINGKTQPDFNSLILSTALMKKETVATVEVERYDETGKKINVTLKLRPEKMSAEAKGLLGMGVGPASTLKNPDMSPELASEMSEEGSRLKDYEQVKSGETIIEVNGIPVAPNRFDILHKALQAGNGQPVDITVQAKNGEKRHEKVSPYLETSVWGDETAYVDFAGMEPRVMIAAVQKESDAVGKLLAGDVIVGLKLKDLKLNPNNREIREMFFEAGSSKEQITVQVDRNGEVKQVE